MLPCFVHCISIIVHNGDSIILHNVHVDCCVHTCVYMYMKNHIHVCTCTCTCKYARTEYLLVLVLAVLNGSEVESSLVWEEEAPGFLNRGKRGGGRGGGREGGEGAGHTCTG